MPGRYSQPNWSHHWPVKIMRGTFSRTKRWELEARYRRRRIRLEFRDA